MTTPETFDRQKLRAELERDEGRRSKPYVDTEGHLTVGVGWNLDANGLPEEIIDRLLDIAIDRAAEVLDALEPRWRQLDPPRQRVLLNLAFQLGPVRLAGFRRFLGAIGEFLDGGTEDALHRAAEELLSSKLNRQTPNRVARHVAVLRPVSD